MGCSLNCPWCQNPESKYTEPILYYSQSRCIKCGICINSCQRSALRIDDRIHIDRSKCILCKSCVEVCPGGALFFAGENISARRAVDRLLRDREFFGIDGGITLSGGEPLLQYEFAGEILSLCQRENIDTAIETCLAVPQESVMGVLNYVNHFLVDIKILDNGLHKQYLGQGNENILQNYRFLVSSGADMITRIPLIPGYTANERNIRGIGEFIYNVNPNAKVELLNFNPLCRSKYEDMEIEFPIKESNFTDSQMNEFYNALKRAGIKNIVME